MWCGGGWKMESLSMRDVMSKRVQGSIDIRFRIYLLCRVQHYFWHFICHARQVVRHPFANLSFSYFLSVSVSRPRALLVFSSFVFDSFVLCRAHRRLAAPWRSNIIFVRKSSSKEWVLSLTNFKLRCGFVLKKGKWLFVMCEIVNRWQFSSNHMLQFYYTFPSSLSK